MATRRHTKTWSVGIGALAITLLAGCLTTTMPHRRDDAPRLTGEIVRVNARGGYVIAKCSVLPSPGEEATVIRGNQPVGRIRFSKDVRPPYAAADLIEGRALAGDRWRIARESPDAPLEKTL